MLRKSTTYLYPRLWSEGEAGAELYIMRCVLPHIPAPWGFLASLAEANPGFPVLVKFLQLQFILLNDLWYQISHDHVNPFRMSDFSDRYEVIANGNFVAGEWAWVPIDPSTFTLPPRLKLDRPFGPFRAGAPISPALSVGRTGLLRFGDCQQGNCSESHAGTSTQLRLHH